MPEGIYHISGRKYITFPSGKISKGIAKNPFRNALLQGLFFMKENL